MAAPKQEGVDLDETHHLNGICNNKLTTNGFKNGYRNGYKNHTANGHIKVGSAPQN